jgi:hypothetical protein
MASSTHELGKQRKAGVLKVPFATTSRSSPFSFLITLKNISGLV